MTTEGYEDLLGTAQDVALRRKGKMVEPSDILTAMCELKPPSIEEYLVDILLRTWEDLETVIRIPVVRRAAAKSVLQIPSRKPVSFDSKVTQGSHVAVSRATVPRAAGWSALSIALFECDDRSGAKLWELLTSIGRTATVTTDHGNAVGRLDATDVVFVRKDVLGLEPPLCRRLRVNAASAQALIIVYDAHAGRDHGLAELPAGADLYLEPPLTPPRIIDALCGASIDIHGPWRSLFRLLGAFELQNGDFYGAHQSFVSANDFQSLHELWGRARSISWSLRGEDD